MSFWEGRRVLVTGADGFIGSHLVERLLRDGATVRALCCYNSFGSHGWLDEEPPEAEDRLELRLGDVRDSRLVQDACRGVEVVFHLAALIAIPYSYQAPESFIDTNVRGTLNVLEAVRSEGCRRLVHTSTSEVYGTPESVPIRESHPLRAQSPYAASKLAADKLCEAWAASFETPVVTLRPFNTYGPRQSQRAVLPTILAQMLVGAAELRLGSLEPRRDLTYVADTVDGFVRAGEAQDLEAGEVIQLGTGDARSIGELVELARGVTGSAATVVTDPARVRPARSEVMTLVSDPARARARLGWTPVTGLEDGVRKTASWLAPRLAGRDVGRYQL